MATTNELEFTIENRKDSLSEKTITNYANYYKRLRALLPHDVKDMSEDDIIEAIKNAVNTTDKKKMNEPLPATTKQSLLNVAIVIRQVYKKDIGDLIQYRTASKDDVLEANVARNKELKETLPTVKQLIEYTDKLYEEGKYAKYILNYLMLAFAVRNMDLNVIITKKANDVNNKDNWLVLRNNSVRYLRYVFKTADTYDCRENEIKSDKFIKAVKELLGDKEQTYLLTTADGERIKEVNLAKYISRATMNELGQSAYFKILLNKNKQDIEKLSSNRGTSLNNVVEYYDIDFTNEEGKQKKKQAQRNTTACKKIPSGEDGKTKKALKKQKKEEGLAKAHATISGSEAEESEEEVEVKAPAKSKKLKGKKKLVVEE